MRPWPSAPIRTDAASAREIAFAGMLRALSAAICLIAISMLALAQLPEPARVLAQAGSGEPPSACGLVITETAPASVRVCDEAQITVTMQVTRPEALPLHVVVMVAKHLLMYDHLDDAKRAAREVVDGLEFSESTRVGVVTLSAQSKTELELTNKKSSVLSAINRIKLDQVRPEARYYDWLAEAEDLLAAARDEAISPVEIILFVSTGCPIGFETYCQRQKASSSRVQGKGVTIVGICNPNASIPPPALPRDHCNDIRNMASTGSYYDLRQSSRAAARLQELEREGKAIEPRELILTEKLAPGMRYVAGSGLPEPKVNAERLIFEWDKLVAGQVVTASYRLAPEAEGRLPLRPEGSSAVVIDSLQRSSLPQSLPTRTLQVLPCAPPSPTATATQVASETPSPSPTPARTATPVDTPAPSATPSPSATSTSLPGTIYLPLLARRLCKTVQAHSDVILAIDTSSSMNEMIGDARRLDAAILAASRFVELLALDGGGDRVAILDFNRSTALRKLDDDRAAILADLQQLQTAAGTRLDLALRLGLDELAEGTASRGASQVIVLLTDGQAESGSEAATLSAAQAARQQGVDVYAVAFGTGASSDFLRAIASRPETYLEAPDPDSLRRIYEAIAGDLPCPGGVVWGQSTRGTAVNGRPPTGIVIRRRGK